MPKSKLTKEEHERIVKFFVKNQLDRAITLKHFLDEGINRRRAFRVMSPVEKGQIIAYNKNSDPAATVTTDKNVKKIIRLFGRAPKRTVRDVALKCGFSATLMAKLRKRRIEKNV